MLHYKYRELSSALALSLMSVLTCPSVLAQNVLPASDEARRDMRAPSPNETPVERRARLLANLEMQVKDLSPSQKNQILAIYEQSSDQMRAVREDKTLSPEQHAEKIRQIHTAIDAQITPLLSEAQRVQRQQALATARQVRSERRQGARDVSEIAAPLAPSQAAPPRRTPEQQAEHVLEHYEEALNDLSEDQKKQLYTTMVESNIKSFAVRDDETLNPAERDAKTIQMRADSQLKINAILTPAQQVAWQKAREANRLRALEREQALNGREETAEEKSERLLVPYNKVLLDLSAEQKTKLVAVLDEATDVIESINADTSRTPEQKRNILGRVQKKVDGQVSEILTPAQRKQWKNAPKIATKTK